MPKFPNDLALKVSQRWNHVVGGEYVVPNCPPLKILRQILQVAYVASSAADEGRFPRFNVLIATNDTPRANLGIGVIPFDRDRTLSVTELRRLGPASDFKKSAIWVGYGENSAAVKGLIDLGTAWHRARSGFTYKYRVPSNLILQVDRPGRLKVYQGEFHVATLADGELFASGDFDIPLFMHDIVNKGLERLWSNFSIPKYEAPRDFHSFWFTAQWNIFAAIVNTISLSDHGGMLVIADPDHKAAAPFFRVKYSGPTDALRLAFIEFVNARNRTADFYEKSEQSGTKVSRGVFKAEVILFEAVERLVEAIRFVAQLAGCDGAIIMAPDLTVLGFGAEIRAEMKNGISVREVVHEMRRQYVNCDVEQFGMRHRSAVKLASQKEGAVILAVSQDGPISAVWRQGNNVFVRKGMSLINMNMPWG